MKKNNLLPIILSSINFVICSVLLIFFTPNKVPFVVGLREKIVLMGSKWWMLSGIILPIIFMVFAIIKKDKLAKLLFTELIIFVCYNNMLGYSFFCVAENLAVGEISQIPLSIAIFLPIALGTFLYGASIKNLDYKNKFGIVSKRTTTTEFIWKQSHITASYHFRLAGFVLFIASIVFIFLRFPLIEFAVFAIGLIIPRIVVEVGANKMSKKYKDMKQKFDHIQQTKAEQEKNKA